MSARPCVCMFLCVERVREGVCVQKLLRGITLNCMCVKRESGQQLPREITIRDNYVGPCV